LEYRNIINRAQNSVFYDFLLKKILFKHSTESFKTLIKDKEFEEAIQLSKNIKDTAKDISANRLFNISARVELSIREKSSDTEKVIEEFDLELNKLLDMIDSFRDNQ